MRSFLSKYSGWVNLFALVVVSCLFLNSCIKRAHNKNIQELIDRVENSLLPQVVIEGDSVKHFTIEERMDQYKVPGLSIAVVDNWKIHWAKGYGYISYDTLKKVDETTMFQAASISKPVAALMALKLVQEGKLTLDNDVNIYLKDWKIETNKFTEGRPVTLRGLLTHTAGLTVHGFRGYAEGEAIPDIIQILNGESPANSEPIKPDTVPGSVSRYSGGGYTVMQKMLEDIAGESFPELMKKNILDKIGMENSTYHQPLPESYFNQASFGNRGDKTRIKGNWHTYPEMAAAGLWTTPADLSKYMIEVQQSYKGKSNKILSREMTVQMLTDQAEGQGLGPGVNGAGDSLTFSHGGANEGFRCMFWGDVKSGKGFVIMTNSDNGSGVTWEIIRGISEVYNWDVFNPVVRKVAEMSYDSLLKYEGTYKASADYIVDITGGDGKLNVRQQWDNNEYCLYPCSDLIFFTTEDNTEFVFEKGTDNKIARFTVMGRFVFEKL